MLPRLATAYPIFAVFIVVFMLFPTFVYPAPQQGTDIRSQGSPEGCPARRSASAKDSSDEEVESLIAKARKQGTVNIIVKLCLDFVPEGNLPNDRRVREQRQVIAQTQNKLLKRLAPYKVNAVRKYKFTPLLAMHANASALMYLQTSSLVAGIEEDKEVLSAP